MIELTYTNFPLFLSWLTQRLEDEEAEASVLDTHTATVKGPLCNIQSPVCVADDVLDRSRFLLKAESLL